MNIVDDATNIARLHFEREETRIQYGVPGAFYADGRNMYHLDPHKEHNFFTMMCEVLGIRVIPAHSPQAKGRVERYNGVHQRRLIPLMKLDGVQDMESAEHPFICTTNLIDRLDQASLRRFTFKVKYDFMTPEQRTKAFETFFGFKDIPLTDAENLTPADFALVYEKAKILGVLDDPKELLKMLMSEQTIKAPPKVKIGF